jgi:hypothetical protein
MSKEPLDRYLTADLLHAVLEAYRRLGKEGS